VRVPGTDRAELTAAGRAFMGMKPNGRRFRRNGYRVVGAGGLKVPQVFGAHHQAVQYGDKAFGERNYVVEFVFKANAARHVEHHLWLKKKYGLTGPQASQLVARSDIDAVLRKVDDWAFEHGAATSSPLVRGYFTDLLNGPERYGRNRRRRAA
jgi:hypothetical protein